MATGSKQASVHVEERRVRQPAFDVALAWPGIRKNQPQVGDLAGREKASEQLYLGAQEGGVVKVLFQCKGTALPYPFAFDIYTDKIPVGETCGKAYCIFSAATSKFNGNGTVISEHQFVPPSLYLVINGLRRFDDVLSRLDNPEPFQFPFHIPSTSATTNVLPPINTMSSGPAACIAVQTASATSGITM